jgi:glycosyltransferase involved in cell wall biosynthesis
MMRILFDGYWWADGPPSGRNVLTSIVREWSVTFPRDELTLALSAKTVDATAHVPPGVRVIHTRVRQHGFSTAFELGLTRGYDVVFSQNFTPLSSRALRVTFVHDVMFQEHPEWFTRAERLYLAAVPALAARSDVVVTSSEAEAHRIVRLNPRLKDRTRAVGLGLAHSFSEATPDEPDLRLVPGEYVLAVGRLNVRKNLERLIVALSSHGFINPGFPLVVVGQEDGFRAAMPNLEVSSAAGSVIRTGFVSDAQLRWLYSQCATFVFPSLDEGFGLPILEAAHSGAPMAISAIPAFEEFGDVGSFFDPRDTDAIAAAVAESMAHGARPDAHHLAARYSWGSTVERIRDLILDKV